MPSFNVDGRKVTIDTDGKKIPYSGPPKDAAKKD